MATENNKLSMALESRVSLKNNQRKSSAENRGVSVNFKDQYAGQEQNLTKPDMCQLKETGVGSTPDFLFREPNEQAKSRRNTGGASV